jgi:hypothetical protein
MGCPVIPPLKVFARRTFISEIKQIHRRFF